MLALVAEREDAAAEARLINVLACGLILHKPNVRRKQVRIQCCQRSEWASEASRDRADILLGAVPLVFAITLDDRAEQH